MASARRVVTGINSAGRSTVMSDEHLPERTGAVSAVMIYTSAPAATVPIRTVPSEHSTNNRPPPYGTGWGLIQFAPSKDPHGPPRPLHTTDTIDYLVVRSGEVTMLLDDGVEVTLRAGDYLVQGGVAHGWVNRSSSPCMAEVFFIGLPHDGK